MESILGWFLFERFYILNLTSGNRTGVTRETRLSECCREIKTVLKLQIALKGMM